jgi:Rad3-related DNA helicase
MKLLLDSKIDISRLKNMVENLKDISLQDNQKDARLKVYTKSLLSNIFMVLENLFIKNHSSDFRMVLASTRSKTRGNFELQLSFWCLNSGVVFADIGKDCRSVILMSGTLSPLGSFQRELGIEFANTVEALHVIKPDQIWARVIPCGPDGKQLIGTYEHYTQFEYQDTLGLSILGLVEKVPKGVLVFVSSYQLLETLRSRWTDTGIWDKLSASKQVFEEPRHGNAETTNIVYKRYSAAAITDQGAMMFCIYRGKMSEGME